MADVDVEAVSFPNLAGLTLWGTLHRPRKSGADLPAVVLLSPGVKMRVGPGRLYVPLTDMLVEHGFTVLRFDFYGLGDSQGELAETMLADVYNHIEVGRFVDDAVAALAWLRKTHGHRRFIVGGLCGGAITALFAAQRDPAVEALLSLGMTVTLASNAATPGKYMTRAQLDKRLKGYLRKVYRPEAWFRFLTLQSDYSVIWHSMKRMFQSDKPRPVAAKDAPAGNGAPQAPVEQRGNANPMFPPAYFAFLERGGQALMMFSEKDRLHSEYEEKFVEPFAARIVSFEKQIRKHVIPNSNHVMTLHEWQREMVDVSRQWLCARYAI